MLVEGNAKLEIVQGDSFSLNIVFENLMDKIIQDVIFSSRALNVVKKLENNLNKFTLNFSSLETINFQNGYFDYDLTIKFSDNTVKTLVYRSAIVILNKVNGVVGL